MAPHFLHRSQSSQSHRSLTSIIASSISRAGSPDSNAPLLSSAKPIEEETLPKYSHRTFYAAKIGDRLNNRYEVIAKLGYGMTATVWLARDLHASPGPNSRKYVTIKINVNTLSDDFLKGRREIARKLMMTNPKHPGYSHVRFMLEAFTLKGKHGEHLCIVYDVLREPIDECRDKYLGGTFSSTKLRVLLPALLQGLDYMHSECHVVHTDLKADNIMMGLGSDPNSVLEKFAAHQHSHPAPRKPPYHHDGHIIYQSCSDLLLVGDKKDCGNSMNDSVLASTKITDIGLAEWGDRGLQHKPIQSNAFTCPEVLIGAGWSYPADIWNLGVMLWDLIETHGLFDHIKTSPGQYKAEEHLALMIVLLGPPPTTFLDRGLKTSKYFTWNKETNEYTFNNQKKLKEFKNVLSWDLAVTHMQGDNKASFIDFAKKMIAWDPEERWTAKQLLEHPWLKSRPGTVTCICQDYEKASRSLSAGAEKDAELEKERTSAAASIASSEACSDSVDYFPKSRDQSPPKLGISQRTTNSSFMSLESLKEHVPSLVVSQSK